MKKMVEIQELRNKDKKELFKDLRHAQKKLTGLGFDNSFKKLKNYHEISVVRKRIARIWTILAEKSLSRIN